jgi:hypothetical protein
MVDQPTNGFNIFPKPAIEIYGFSGLWLIYRPIIVAAFPPPSTPDHSTQIWLQGAENRSLQEK